MKPLYFLCIFIFLSCHNNQTQNKVELMGEIDFTIIELKDFYKYENDSNLLFEEYLDSLNRISDISLEESEMLDQLSLLHRMEIIDKPYLFLKNEALKIYMISLDSLQLKKMNLVQKNNQKRSIDFIIEGQLISHNILICESIKEIKN